MRNQKERQERGGEVLKDEMIPCTLSMFQVDRLSYMKPCIEVTLMYFMRLGKEKPTKRQRKVQFCKMKIIIYTFSVVKIQYIYKKRGAENYISNDNIRLYNLYTYFPCFNTGKYRLSYSYIWTCLKVASIVFYELREKNTTKNKRKVKFLKD